MNTTIDNTEPPQHSSHKYSNTERKLNPPPKDSTKPANFVAYFDAQYHEKFNAENIAIPIVSDSQLISYTALNRTDCESQLGYVFDSEANNGQRLEMAKHSLPAKERSAETVSQRVHKVAQHLLNELPNAIRAVFTNEKLATENSFSKWDAIYASIALMIGISSELLNQASVLHSSGYEEFAGMIGWVVSISMAFLNILFTLALKAFLATAKASNLRRNQRVMMSAILILFLLWSVVFVVKYQWSAENDGEPLNAPWLNMSVFVFQLLILPLVYNSIWLYLKKHSEQYLKQHISYDAEHLAVDEELESLSLRYDDTNIMIGYLHGFITGYEAKRQYFIHDTYLRIQMIQYELDGYRAKSLSDMYKQSKETTTTKLTVVK